MVKEIKYNRLQQSFSKYIKGLSRETTPDSVYYIDKKFRFHIIIRTDCKEITIEKDHILENFEKLSFEEIHNMVGSYFKLRYLDYITKIV